MRINFILKGLTVLTLWAALIGAVQAGQEPPLIINCSVPLLPADPPLDGNMDAPGWQAAAGNLPLFAFRTEPPFEVAPELKTTARIGYTKTALWVGVYCYETNMAGIRARHTQRDDGSLWEDDCVEIYISPDNDPKTTRKFTVNSIGTMMDMMGNQDINWNAPGWKVGTARHPDGWSVEVKIPWSDLGGAMPAEMDFWSFSLIRFAWTSGAYQGVVTAPGMYSSRMDRMGFIVFGDRWNKMLEQVPAFISKRKGACWRVPSRQGFYTYTTYDFDLRQTRESLQNPPQICRYNLWRLSNDRLAGRLAADGKTLADLEGRMAASDQNLSLTEWLSLKRNMEQLCREFSDLQAQMKMERLLGK